MRITFVSPPPNYTGGLRVIAAHADGLRALGHDVCVVAPRHRQLGWKDHLRALVRGRRAQPPPSGSHYDGMQAALRLVPPDNPITDAEVPDADVVIATWWETAFYVAALAPEKGRKFYLVQGHEVFAFRSAHLAAGSYYLPLRKIVIARWLQQEMAARYGDHDTRLVLNGVDIAQFRQPPRRRGSGATVGVIYSTYRMKGLDVALAAIERLRLQRPDLTLVAFSTDRPSPELPLPPGTRFFHAPAQGALADIYGQCDVFVLPSRSEGFGLPVLEAMACGCPVVATAAGCAPDIIEEGVNGHMVPVEDVAALADRIDAVLALPPGDWERMSQAALATAHANRWEEATRRLEAALLAP